MTVPKRNLRLHEYQALSLLQEYRVPIPLGNIAFTGKEALYQARNIARATDYKSVYAVKAQVQTSNRSKGVFLENGFEGGIHIVQTPEEVKIAADGMCGKTLVTPSHDQEYLTHYTGKQGFLCRCVYVLEALKPKKAFYIRFGLDRKEGCPYMLYGVDKDYTNRKSSKYPSVEDMQTIYIDI